MKLNIAVLYGSVRTERQGIRAARFVLKMLEKRQHKITFIDPIEYKLPLLDYMYKEYDEGEAPENMEKIATILDQADAFVIVTGEYNHGIPPAMKNLLDHFQKQYLFKPSGITSYSAGPFAGVKAAVKMRSVLGELGTPSISTIVPYPNVSELFDEEGNTPNELAINSTNQFIDELEWYAEALKEQRKKGKPF
jgi:NAD(P)H-dependent FMN reductase